MLWSGRFDEDGNPTLTFRVSADDKTASVEVTGIIDTGFTGFVLLPKTYVLSLGLRQRSTTRLRLADDSICIAVLADAFISLDANTGRQGIVTLEDNCKEVLVGMDFMRQFALALALTSKTITLIDETMLDGLIASARS